jgi:hypothetical protein
MYSKNQLEKHILENPDFCDKEDLEQHLEDEEISLEEWIDKLHKEVNNSIYMLLESAFERFEEDIDRWYENGDYHNHEIPEGADSAEFARLVRSEAYNGYRKAMINTSRTPNWSRGSSRCICC